jgi:hypothetical protein
VIEFYDIVVLTKIYIQGFHMKTALQALRDSVFPIGQWVRQPAHIIWSSQSFYVEIVFSEGSLSRIWLSQVEW